MKRVKVLLVDDSSTIREHLKAILAEDSRLLLVGEAHNGEEAVRLTRSLKPDVISMDIHMPVMNGLDAIKEIMRIQPTPIVVVSSGLENNELNIAFNATRAGALTVIATPPAPTHSMYREICREFVDMLYNMSQVAVIHHWGVQHPTRKSLNDIPPFEPTTAPKIKVIGIASSTGGPSALAEILSQIPSDFPVPFVIVQHISKTFEQGLVDWLNRVTYLKVAIASDQQLLEAGQVLIAPSGTHLRLDRNGKVKLDSRRGSYLNMPSADVMLQSLAESYGSSAAGVILTGMGDDGAKGIRAIYDAGGKTIAQDETTSVVFGMPYEAIRQGAAQTVLPIQKIARVLIRFVTPPVFPK